MKIYVKDYNLDCFKEKDLYEFDEIIDILENYESEIYELKEELENLKEDVEENYRRIPYGEQVCISDRDFI